MLSFIDLAEQQTRIRKQILRAIEGVLEHGQYIMGKEVTILEEKLAEYAGSQYCVCTSSGTDAILIALMAKDIRQGDEVITTPFTFISTAESIVRTGAQPVFVDIDPATYNINADQVEKSITPKTKAVLAVSLFGQCPDFDALQKICEKHNLVLIEDAAQSFGAEYKGKKSCSIAEISCTSFFPAKPLGCYGDGGACFTNDSSIAKTLREIIDHGQSQKYHYSRHGINGRFDTLQAAILIEKLKIFPDELFRRIEIAERYTLKLKDYVQTPLIAEYNKSIYSQYVIETEEQSSLQSKLRNKNILTAIYYPKPLYRQSIFHGSNNGLHLKNTDNACSRVLSIPVHPYLTLKNQDMIVKILIESLKKTI